MRQCVDRRNERNRRNELSEKLMKESENNESVAIVIDPDTSPWYAVGHPSENIIHF